MDAGKANTDLTLTTDSSAVKSSTMEEILLAGLNCAGGCIAGMASTVAGHPFDTVKVRLQTQQNIMAAQDPLRKIPIYQGTWNCFKATIQSEGPHGLFKGMLSPMLGQGCINLILFGCERTIERQIQRIFGTEMKYNHIIAGGAAGAVQSLVACPMELGKVRMQLQGQGQSHQFSKVHTENYRGSINCIYRIYQQEGIRGCYRGMGVTLWRDAPGFMVYFGFFEYLCVKMKEWKQVEKLGIPDLAVLGGTAGMSSWVISHPFDVIKSRFQADGVKGDNKYSSAIDCLKKSVKGEGSRVLVKGIVPNLMRGFIVSAVIFPIEEYFRRWHGYGQGK
ncbi:mitochondrial basic amino acids transporter-like [Glandiceps talaboti]